jgi:hypothetical protein
MAPVIIIAPLTTMRTGPIACRGAVTVVAHSAIKAITARLISGVNIAFPRDEQENNQKDNYFQ